MKKTNLFLIIAITSFILFALLIILLKTVDVNKTGVADTVVGLSTINLFVRDKIGSHLVFYIITDWIGVIGLVVAFIFGLTGLCQWIKRKNMFKVDYEILILGALYLIILGLYFFFEKFVINYRPLILYKNPEPSFPSSHTFITCIIMSTSIRLYNKYISNKKIKMALYIISALIIAITIVGRIISGVHWITDILGGVILIICLTFLYYYFVEFVKSKIKS